MKLLNRIAGRLNEFLQRSSAEAEGVAHSNGHRNQGVALRDLESPGGAKGGAANGGSRSALGSDGTPELPKEISALQRAIEDLYGCEAAYRRSEHVRDKFQRDVVWDGFVCVFKLLGHPTANYCYAWRFKLGDETHLAAILETPPVDSVESAVTFAMRYGGSGPITN